MNDHRFQVDLRGVIDLLSRHLYSSPDVFVRELLQNSVDAISARRQETNDDFAAQIEVELITAKDGTRTIVLSDNGIGLTEKEVHQFLATIGQSSKREVDADRPSDFLGKFGIGLLSGFLVSDEIVAVTRSAKDGDHPAVEWKGNTDGTYAVRTLTQEVPIGTQVYLRSNKSSHERFAHAHLEKLLTKYGEYLPTRTMLKAAGSVTLINNTPPWELADRDERLTTGEQTFGERHWDAIPLWSPTGGVRGVAYVLKKPAHSRMRHPHQVYLRNMLVSDSVENLMPEWAFFVQCIVNGNDLRPTASRESFYEDAALHQTREELADCLRQYLKDMARQQPDKLQKLIDIHHLAIKAIAVDDEECLQLFAPWLPFETTSGRSTLQDFVQKHGSIRYVTALDDYRQIKQVAMAESVPVLNAGYVYDSEIIERLSSVYPDIEISPFQVDEISDRFETLTAEEAHQSSTLRRVADECLREFDCVVDVCKFQPEALPSMYVLNSQAAFMRSVRDTQDIADELWTDVLAQVANSATSSSARLHLNYRNPLIRQICRIEDETAQARIVQLLYVQSLLLGHFPLQHGEQALLSNSLGGLVHWATDLRAEAAANR